MVLNSAIFNPITDLLGAINQRQKIASSNIANAQTPGYTAKEASFGDLLFSAQQPFEVPIARQFGPSLVENGMQDTGAPVKMERELITMQENAMLYSVASRRLSTIITALRTASQVGR